MDYDKEYFRKKLIESKRKYQEASEADQQKMRRTAQWLADKSMHSVIRIELMMFRTDGQAMDIDLRPLMLALLTEPKQILKVHYDSQKRVFSYVDEDMDIVFPEENNRFSITVDPKLLLYVIKKIYGLYPNQQLMVSTPGYESFIDASAPEAEIRMFLGME